jgi:hypothetical protein
MTLPQIEAEKLLSRSGAIDERDRGLAETGDTLAAPLGHRALVRLADQEVKAVHV